MVLNAYTIVFAALLVPAGKVADRIGHRISFIYGSSIFTVASMACGLAPNVELLIGFRMVQAAGAAILIPSSLALVIRGFPREKIPQAVAIWGAAGAVAGALGPTLGSAIVETLGWRWAFYINLPIGLFTVGAGLKALRESADPETKIPSLAGVVLIARAAGLLSYGVVESNTFGWSSGRTLAVLGAGFALLVMFVGHQKRTDAPALSLELFGVGNFTWGTLSTFAFGIAFSGVFFGSILFLTDVWGWSILKAGFGVAPGPALVAVIAPFAGRLAGRIGQRPIVLAGGVLFAAGGLYRLVMLGPEINYLGDYFPSMVLSGVGVAFCFPQLTSVVAQSVPANRLGVGGAVLQAVRQFGATFGVALTIAFLAASAGPDDALSRFDRVWVIIVVGGLATTALALGLRTGSSARDPLAATI